MFLFKTQIFKEETQYSTNIVNCTKVNKNILMERLLHQECACDACKCTLVMHITRFWNRVWEFSQSYTRNEIHILSFSMKLTKHTHTPAKSRQGSVMNSWQWKLLSCCHLFLQFFLPATLSLSLKTIGRPGERKSEKDCCVEHFVQQDST